MKNLLLVLLLITTASNAIGQNLYKKGYYIDNNGENIKCLIQDIDWKNNPVNFKIKRTAIAEPEIIDIKDAKEFGLYKINKFVRATVDIDRSGNIISNYSNSYEPEFNRETIYLKVLVEGDATLYTYKDHLFLRFFYQKSEEPIKQLIHKKYIKIDNEEQEKIYTNNFYQKQIYKNIVCDKKISHSEIRNLKYNKSELVKYFISYNTCKNALKTVYKEDKRKQFRLNFRPGLNYYTITSSNQTINEMGFRIGLELEYILPYNNNKWSILVEPTYESFPFNNTVPDRYYSSYHNLKFPIGGRYYMYLKNHDSFFVNILFGYDFSINSISNYNFFSLSSYIYGIGYKKNNRLAVELRFKPNHFLVYNFYYPRYNTLSVIASYTLL